MTAMVVTLPEQSWIDGLLERSQTWDGVQLAVWDLADAPELADPEAVAMVVLPYTDPAPALESAAALSNLRYVQTLTAGYDGLIERLPAGVSLCNAAGVHDASTAELAVGLTLAAQRGIGIAARDQTRGRWRHRRWPSLADRRVLLVGSGGVGRAIATRLAPFEIDLVRVASRARHDADGPVHGVDQLPGLLPDAEVVILACPLTADTHRLFGARLLALMPDDALLVNVSRGPVVDTEALHAELRTGRLRAAVDVIDPEPFPPDHPLRQCENLLITPHVGGDSTAFRPRALAMLSEQLTRLASGRTAAHIVHHGDL
jgi:phosphoglycerate dehydrogenase-like enzyme